MRHFFLTFLLVLAIIPLKHHFIDTSPRLLKMYDDNLIRIGFWESYNLEKHINYYYKNVDGHRRFKTFFEYHRYDVQFMKLNYFTDTQEGRDELNLYSEEIQKQSSAFNQYEADYRKRRQENMDYRKSATINYQQQLADSQNQGVAGVRTNRNFYNQFSPNRRQSPRGTFNRDSWRIQNLNL